MSTSSNADDISSLNSDDEKNSRKSSISHQSSFGMGLRSTDSSQRLNVLRQSSFGGKSTDAPQKVNVSHQLSFGGKSIDPPQKLNIPHQSSFGGRSTVSVDSSSTGSIVSLDGKHRPPSKYARKRLDPMKLIETTEEMYTSGMSFKKSGDYIRACQKLECVSATEPSWLQPKIDLIEMYSEINDWNKCAAICKIFTTTHPDIISSHCTYAWALRKIKRYDDAIEACTNGLQYFPNSAQLYSLRGQCNYDAEYYKQATSDFHHTIELNRLEHNLSGTLNALKPWKRSAWRLR
eukprot:gene9256-19215_t